MSFTKQLYLIKANYYLELSRFYWKWAEKSSGEERNKYRTQSNYHLRRYGRCINIATKGD